jgi:hypothetical protein
MNSGFSELVLVLPASAVQAAREFASEAERLRATDPVYKHLQIGVSRGVLPDPLPHPIPQQHPIVIEAFKCGLSPSKYSEAIERINHEVV